MNPATKRLHEGIIRGVIQMIRAWQDWLKAQPTVPEQQEQK